MNTVFPTPLVSTEWLARNLDNPRICILDATVLLTPPVGLSDGWTVGSNRGAHDALHMPGSHYADLISAFSAPNGRFTRPSPDLFKSSIEQLAIGPDTQVVIYDRLSGVWAARLWWVMRSFGVDQSSVLDGGFNLWRSQGLPTTSEMLTIENQTSFILEDRPRLFADRAGVQAIVEHGGACLVNALDAREFYATETAGYARPGRIPGSLNVPASSLTDPASGRFLTLPELHERFAEVVAQPGRKVLYCGGGIAACADALALAMLGETDIAVYDASYEEWAADLSLPVEVGQYNRTIL